MCSIIPDVATGERCCSDLPEPGATSLMKELSKPRKLFVKCLLSYFLLLHSGNMTLLIAGALFLFPERGCLDVSH